MEPGSRLVEPGDLALEQHLLERATGPHLAGGGVGLVPRQTDGADLPGTLAADAAARLLDEVVLGQLAQVPRAVGGRLVEPVGQLGGGQRAGHREQLHDPQPHRVGQGGQLPGVLQPPVRRPLGPWLLVHGLETTLSKGLLQ